MVVVINKKDTDTHFLREMTRLMSWPGRVRHSLSAAVSLSSHLSYSLFFFLGLEVYCILCSVHSSILVVSRHACCNGHGSCVKHFSLELVEARILNVAPAVIRPMTTLISFCTFPLALWRLFSLSTVQTWRSCSASGAPWSSAMPPSLGRGWERTKEIIEEPFPRARLSLCENG